MAETTQARRKLIIKLYLRRSATTNGAYSAVNERSEIERITAKENSRAIGKDSRTVSKVCALKNKKGYYAAAIWVNIENNPSKSSGVVDSKTSKKENPSKSHGVDSRISKTTNPSIFSGVADSRSSRKEYEECKLKNKRESAGVECNKREKKRKMQHTNTMMMNSSRKSQCWTTLKRLMVGRDAWALKHPLVHHNSQSITKPNLMGLEDIESKLRKLKYSEVDHFAHDIRRVFSYALEYPPKSGVHRTARRISEDFEVNWKRLKEKWLLEKRDQRKKIRLK